METIKKKKKIDSVEKLEQLIARVKAAQKNLQLSHSNS